MYCFKNCSSNKILAYIKLIFPHKLKEKEDIKKPFINYRILIGIISTIKLVLVKIGLLIVQNTLTHEISLFCVFQINYLTIYSALWDIWSILQMKKLNLSEI